MRRSTLFLISFLVTVLAAGPALAVSARVKNACRDDYFRHCSMHSVGTPELRSCMRAVGPRLSGRCIAALKADGQIKRSDMRRYAKSKGRYRKKTYRNKGRFTRKRGYSRKYRQKKRYYSYRR